MGKRLYEARSDRTSMRLELDDDGTFEHSEEEWNSEHTMGADTKGRWEIDGVTLLLHVTKSSFGKRWHMWQEGTTERGTLEGDVVTLGGVTMKLLEPLWE